MTRRPRGVGTENADDGHVGETRRQAVAFAYRSDMEVPMDETTLTPGAQPADTADTADTADMVEQDLLVEEISIDGMCGVY